MGFENQSKDTLERRYYEGVLDGTISPSLVADDTSFTGRMFARNPASGYSFWLDTADASFIYLAEAPSSDAGTASTFRGIRVPKDANGNPLGKVEVATSFIWNSRSSAVWS